MSDDVRDHKPHDKAVARSHSEGNAEALVAATLAAAVCASSCDTYGCTGLSRCHAVSRLDHSPRHKSRN